MRLKTVRVFVAWTGLALVAVLVGWAAYCSTYLNCCWADWIIPGASTRFSSLYSERAFRDLRIGMSRQQVVDSLGTPLKVLECSGDRIKRMIDYNEGQQLVTFPDLSEEDPSGITEIIWYYSQPENARAHWCVRIVAFSPKGVVQAIERDIYID